MIVVPNRTLIPKIAWGGHGGCTGSRVPLLEREFDAESCSAKSLGDLVRRKTTAQGPTLFRAGLPPHTLLSARPPIFIPKRIRNQVHRWSKPRHGMSLGSPALNKMAIFLQSRAFPLTGTLFFTPPPLEDCKHDLE